VFAKREFLLLITAIVFLVLPKSVLAADFGDVVINEVMWMGSSKSFRDEWIELRNNTSQEIQLNGWQIDNLLKKNVAFVFPDEPIIEIGGGEFFLVSYYSKVDQIEDKTVLNNEELIWRCNGHFSCASFSLANSNPNNGDLVLRDFSGKEIDRAPGDPWPAGKKENGICYSMERINPLSNGKDIDNWATATEAKNLISGVLDKATPGSENSSFLSQTSIATPTLTQTPMHTLFPLPTNTLTPTSTPASTPTPTPSPTPTSTPTFTPTPTPAKAIYQINEVKNENGDILSSVKIYIDDQYIHHYAPETLEFCDGCYCDDDKEVGCGFGDHTIRLEKNGYQDWSEVKAINTGDSYVVDPVMILLLVSTPIPTPTATPTISIITFSLPTLTVSPSWPAPSFVLRAYSLVKNASPEPQVEPQVLGEQSSKQEKALPSLLFWSGGVFYIAFPVYRLKRQWYNEKTTNKQMINDQCLF